eukprot:2064051-Ditylum_brightwellii.AAC.1
MWSTIPLAVYRRMASGWVAQCQSPVVFIVFLLGGGLGSSRVVVIIGALCDRLGVYTDEGSAPACQ